MIKNMKKLLRYICAILTAFLIIFWARKLLLANFHKLIEITPEEVITIFQDAGYKIDNCHEVNEGDMGPMGQQNQGYQFDLHARNSTYQIYVEDFGDWQNARNGAKNINKLDKRMNGDNFIAFHYGLVVVAIYPSDKVFSSKLHWVIARNYK